MLDKLFFRCFFLVCMFVSAMSTDPRCSEPLDQGTGDKHEIKFYFNSDEKTCHPFFYKGEGSSRNRFDNEKSCIFTCDPESAQMLFPEGDQVCSLPAKHGPCHAMQLKYFFDSEQKVCRLFHYGGCQGNGNRFDSKDICISTCQGKAGRLFGLATDFNPDETSVNAGLIVGVVGGVVFAVAVIAAIALAVVQRNDRKRVPTKEVEMAAMS